MADRVDQSIETSFHDARKEIKLSPEQKRVQEFFIRAEMINDLIGDLEKGVDPIVAKEHFYDRFQNEEDRLIINGFIECSSKVKEAKFLATKEAHETNTTMEVVLARGVVDPDHKNFLPKGEIEVTDYSLAIEVVTTDDGDYSKILHTRNPERNGGEYKDNVGVNYYFLKKDIHIPFIGLRRKSSKAHEDNHAVNHVLMKTYSELLPKVKKNDNKNVYFDKKWGQLIGFNSFSAMGDLEKAMKGGVKIENIAVTKRYNWALVDAASAAKDELLADIGHSRATSEYQLENVFKVANYDTLGRFFWENNELKQRFYKDREKVIRDNTKTSIELQKFYSTSWMSVEANDGQLWKKRQKIYRLFLAQIPLIEWPEWTSQNSILQKEKEVFERTLNIGNEVIGCLKTTKKWKGMELSGKENNVLNESVHSRKRFEKYVLDESDKLIINGLLFFEYKFVSQRKSLEEGQNPRLEKYKTYSDLVDDLKQIQYSVETSSRIEKIGDVREDVEKTIENLDVELEREPDFDEVIKKYKDLTRSLSEKWHVA